MDHHLRHHQHAELHGAFGSDVFGRAAERLARFFGTPQYILGQSVIVVVWLALNSLALGFQWDPFPWILLNLCFSTQAAYAAPLILLAQTRQASRDRASEESSAKHRQDEFDQLGGLLKQNTDLTREVRDLTGSVADLTNIIHAHICAEG